VLFGTIPLRTSSCSANMIDMLQHRSTCCTKGQVS
jgi:hypothetical protein